MNETPGEKGLQLHKETQESNKVKRNVHRNGIYQITSTRQEGQVCVSGPAPYKSGRTEEADYPCSPEP